MQLLFKTTFQFPDDEYTAPYPGVPGHRYFMYILYIYILDNIFIFFYALQWRVSIYKI